MRGSADHTGIVERAEAGEIVALEGNTYTGNDTNGGMVMRRTRKLSVVAGAFRPAYGPEKAEPAVPGEKGAVPEDAEKREAVPEDLRPGAIAADADRQSVDGIPLVGSAISVVEITARPSLRVRTGPGVEYDQTDSLAAGTRIAVTEQRDGWGRLAGGGWIDLRYTVQR